MLVERKRTIRGERLPSCNKRWKELLANDEQSFLTDNQLSAFVDKRNPGCERMHFYPLPFPCEFPGDKWDFAEIQNRDCLRTIGPSLDFVPESTELSFLPHILEKRMSAGDAAISERCAISGNTMVIEWSMQGVSHTRLSFSLPYYGAEVSSIRNGVLASIRREAFVALSIAGASGLVLRTQDKPFQCNADIEIRPGRKICLAISFGYDRDSVMQSALASAEDPLMVFQRAERTWDDYFTRVVPYFSCSNAELEKLYYYQAYVTRANLYDIPYEPFTHSYTCPWKTGAVWQWSWNAPMNSVCERWLNDKSIGAGGVLTMGESGGALNMGTYLHPLRKVGSLRSHNEHGQKVAELSRQLPDCFDLVSCTTMPHTTPNGLLGAWEFYVSTGDMGFLAKALEVMTEAEQEFSRHELESGLCACTFVDEFDYSLRLRPFVKGFEKGDPRLMFKMDTPFIAVDYNCYLYALRERIIEAARILGNTSVDRAALRAKNSRLKDAVNKYLWDERDGFYYDADPRDMSRSPVKCIAAFAALYSGIASCSQAQQMVEHLTNPAEFGTPYPCPSVAMNTPDVDPSCITYGGDCIVTSGIWFTVEGLVRYGYTDLAIEYVNRTVKMVAAEGPSSSYSYHCITGKYNQDKHTLASQCNILTDLICKYILGIRPTPQGEIELDPAGTSAAGVTSFVFGPYDYRGKTLTVRWSHGSGYEVVSEDQVSASDACVKHAVGELITTE